MSITQKYREVISYVFIKGDGNRCFRVLDTSDIINVFLDIVFSGQFMLLSQSKRQLQSKFVI